MQTMPIRTLGLFLATSLALLGCPSDDAAEDDGADETTDGSATAATATNATVTATTTMTTTEADTSATMTTEVDTSAGTDTSAGSESSSTGDPNAFQFNDTPPEEYVQVDRKGFPAVNTGLNLLGDRDDYNTGDPVEDAAGMFVPNILDSLDTLHRGHPDMQVAGNTGLDDDLAGLGLTACVPPQLANDDCDEQGVPFVIPDTLDIDLDNPPGFPNGRRLEDPVIDIILAVLLLNLVDEAGAPIQPIHPVTYFADLPLNPAMNDAAFPGAFPFLAPAN